MTAGGLPPAPSDGAASAPPPIQHPHGSRVVLPPPHTCLPLQAHSATLEREGPRRGATATVNKETARAFINPEESFDETTTRQACHFLARAGVKEHGLLPRGSNDVFVVELEDGGQTILSIYKPRKGEAPLWDFPDGSLYKREYAAFLVSRALGWYLIPPTVIRKGPFGVGSFQWFVHPVNERISDTLAGIDTFSLQRVAAFDQVLNNADRKLGHFLRGAGDHLWVVDHGLTFHTAPKLRTVLWDFAGQPVPESIVGDLASLAEQLAGGRLRNGLGNLLDREEVTALEGRLRGLIDDPVFTFPQTRHNVPWPPF
jgi:hypothetical protein